jgi:hypothetical protein
VESMRPTPIRSRRCVLSLSRFGINFISTNDSSRSTCRFARWHGVYSPVLAGYFRLSGKLAAGWNSGRSEVASRGEWRLFRDRLLTGVLRRTFGVFCESRYRIRLERTRVSTRRAGRRMQSQASGLARSNAGVFGKFGTVRRTAGYFLVLLLSL